MIRLTDDQMALLKELEATAMSNGGSIDSITIESHDEDMIDLFFRKKVLVRIPSRPRDPQRYRLDMSIILRTDDAEALKQQTAEIELDILLMCAVDVGRAGLKRLKENVRKSLEAEQAEHAV